MLQPLLYTKSLLIYIKWPFSLSLSLYPLLFHPPFPFFLSLFLLLFLKVAVFSPHVYLSLLVIAFHF